ncbi:MAG: hypothetical protein E7147_06120 [Rikenellaceae bacterium]|nr:hypothetical protein [Rikenellaceae bacterium]
MKHLFITLLMALLACACTPDNGGDNNGGGQNNGGYTPTGKITVKGMVYGDNEPLGGVVVSDGLLCVKTNDDGYFEIDSDLSQTKFIHCSLPSGYKAPNDENGVPQFFHRVTDEERKSNLVVARFNLQAVQGDPERYTLIVGADPQPRSSGAGYDNIAYHSLDCCEDFYRDMRETRAKITDREVYGLMLGDIVHENMSLFDKYIAGLSTLGFQMFNILGNHDNDPKSKTDVEGRHSFEEKFGPTYYSFNIGKQHYIVLDNLIMKQRESDGSLRDYGQGITDEIWQWLQNDLRHVDYSTTIMVAAHSPMFRLIDGSERSTSGSTKHGRDYGLLLAKYAKVHAWAGHSHTTYNYVYGEASDYSTIEVHTVARSTGELWTNEYLASGTPRGYTVVEVDGDDISWKFKPTIYQSGKYNEKNRTEGAPEYKYRDWSYDESGVAKIGNKVLDDSYQMKAYPRGTYGDDYIYVDVFLWDNKWEVPYFNGMKMTQVASKYSYSMAQYEISNFYSTYGYQLKDSADYGVSTSGHPTLFRIYEQRATGSGTITVKDRFGNTFSTNVSW